MKSDTQIFHESKKTQGVSDNKDKKLYKAPSLQLLKSVVKMTAGGTGGPQFDVFTNQSNDAS